MTQIRLYERERVAGMLRELGFAAELFANWQNTSTIAHGHDVLEINYVIRGRAVQTVAETTAVLEKGRLSVINYGLEHAITTATEPIDIINLYIDIERVRIPALDEPLRNVLRDIIPLHRISANKLNKVVVLEVGDTESFERLMFNIISESLCRRTGYKEAMRQYFKLFLIMLCRFAGENGFSRSNVAGEKDMAIIELVLDYIESRCGRHLTLDRIAATANIDKYCLCRKFKQITGKTIFEYIKSRRLEAAMYELRSTRKKVIDIALDCGFANVSNFNRCFKQAIGATPTKYRGGKRDKG
jgi:AraC-like DNA-binding protein/quercetin dioxygenase-like cupin family protein